MELMLYALFGGWVAWHSTRLKPFQKLDKHRISFIGFLGGLLAVASLESFFDLEVNIPIKLSTALLGSLVIVYVATRFKRK